MNKFRIIQTQPLTNILPFEVEECHRLWFLPWTVWRPVQERTYTGRSIRTAPRRFQTSEEARVFTEQMLASRNSQQAEQARLLDEQRERRQLRQMPRVVQEFNGPLPA